MRSMAEIGQDVLDELVWDPRVNANAIKISADNGGVVTLSGYGDSYAERLTATEVRRSARSTLTRRGASRYCRSVVSLGGTRSSAATICHLPPRLIQVSVQTNRPEIPLFFVQFSLP
jgi:BON domain